MEWKGGACGAGQTFAMGVRLQLHLYHAETFTPDQKDCGCVWSSPSTSNGSLISTKHFYIKKTEDLIFLKKKYLRELLI